MDLKSPNTPLVVADIDNSAPLQ